jgi:hypothetical protein
MSHSLVADTPKIRSRSRFTRPANEYIQGISAPPLRYNPFPFVRY